MAGYHLLEKDIRRFTRHLETSEYARGSVEKYLRDVRAFASWADGRAVTRELAARWKEHLLAEGLQPVTVNSKLAALNRLSIFLGWKRLHVKYLRVQRKLFRSRDRELTREEYQSLLDTARDQGRERLALMIETICATGIRVSELRYITVEAVRAGRADISLKGKIRTILIPGKLCRKLRKYAAKRKTASGEVFLTGSGRGIGRRQIWAEMKALCAAAGVSPSKVFPHNLRHLFARTYYRTYKDVVRLADVLGHSSVETTRIYLVSTGDEHARQLERLRLVS